MTTLDVLTFNLNSPDCERAIRQLDYLASRPEQVLVLTEAPYSAGCDLLAARFEAAGYNVVFPRPARGERGVMIVSRLATRPGRVAVNHMPHRCVSVRVDTDYGPVEVVGLCVPTRDATDAKVARKRRFLDECRSRIPEAWGTAQRGPLRLVIGAFNILEPEHEPPDQNFHHFEYSFYQWLGRAGYQDAFRALHPKAVEHSWVTRSGGFRFDHAHVSQALAPRLGACEYVHETRTADRRLTNHSALSVSVTVRPAEPLTVTVPESDAEPSVPHPGGVREYWR
ncbi:endonuclease/exonuclease/phosphatase [Streptomyces sp. Tu 6176]|uniref:endonuclease/exonuclease/phosphatase n=1 Tax=Streptomyces sp. Tu 6176 TaxID=1470557 RepID=UPI000B0C4886|nr:endonuclease/exonuclease/phosphatase [Streptomyces sp. Tu 6176]